MLKTCVKIFACKHHANDTSRHPCAFETKPRNTGNADRAGRASSALALADSVVTDAVLVDDFVVDLGLLILVDGFVVDVVQLEVGVLALAKWKAFRQRSFHWFRTCFHLLSSHGDVYESNLCMWCSCILLWAQCMISPPLCSGRVTMGHMGYAYIIVAVRDPDESFACLQNKERKWQHGMGDGL